MHNGNGRQHTPDWQTVKRLVDESTGAVVEITQDVANKFPRFSVTVGREGREPGLLNRHMSVRTEREGSTVVIKEPKLSLAIAALLEDAEDFIIKKAQLMEDDLQRHREERQARQERFEGPKPRQVMRKGKTQRTRDKRAAKRAAKAAEGF